MLATQDGRHRHQRKRLLPALGQMAAQHRALVAAEQALDALQRTGFTFQVSPLR